MGAVERFRLGVDENGLGPRLGPLVVTAVLARVTDEGHVVASRRPRGALAQRLGDSKAMIAHGDVALGPAGHAGAAWVEQGTSVRASVRDPEAPSWPAPDTLVAALLTLVDDARGVPVHRPAATMSACWTHGSIH